MNDDVIVWFIQLSDQKGIWEDNSFPYYYINVIIKTFIPIPSSNDIYNYTIDLYPPQN